MDCYLILVICSNGHSGAVMNAILKENGEGQEGFYQNNDKSMTAVILATTGECTDKKQQPFAPPVQLSFRLSVQ